MSELSIPLRASIPAKRNNGQSKTKELVDKFFKGIENLVVKSQDLEKKTSSLKDIIKDQLKEINDLTYDLGIQQKTIHSIIK